MEKYTCAICGEVGISQIFKHAFKLHGIDKEEYLWKHVLKLPEKPTCANPNCRKPIECYKKYCSKRCKANDPDQKKIHLEHLKRLNSDPKFKERSREIARNLATELCKRPEWKKQHQDHLKRINNDPEIKKKVSEILSSNLKERHKEEWFKKRIFKTGFGHKGWYYSPKAGLIYYRSNWELKAYCLLDDLEKVICYQSEPFPISYVSPEDGKERNYYPDILVLFDDVEFELIEVKPSKYVDDAVVKAKSKAAEEYCKTHDIRAFSIWTEVQIF